MYENRSVIGRPSDTMLRISKNKVHFNFLFLKSLILCFLHFKKDIFYFKNFIKIMFDPTST
jgi:hypothetical protein